MNLNDSIKKCFDYSFGDNKLSPKLESLFSAYRAAIPTGFIHSYPFDVTWKLTSACNLRCKHCFYHSNDSMFNTESDMGYEEIMSLAKFLVEEINIISVALTGGEALLSPYIFELISYLKSKNLIVSILTNGTLIDEDKALKLSKLLNPKFDRIQISLDGPIAEIHDSIRGKGSFEKTLKGIKLLNKYKIPVIITSTVNSLNVDYLEYYAKIFKNYEIQELVLGKYKVFSQTQVYLKPNVEDVFINVAKLLETGVNIRRGFFQAYDYLNFEYGKSLLDNLQPTKKYSDSKLCHNHNKVFISADAKLYLCTSSETSGLCIGDLRKNSFDEIWRDRFTHPLFQERKKIICSGCKYKYWCNAGCPVMAYLNTGSICTAPVECNYQYQLETCNV